MKEEKKNVLLTSAMRSLILNTKDFMFVKDRNFVYVASSPSFAKNCAGLGGVEDVLGKTDFEIFSDQELAAKYRKDDEELFKNGKSMIEYCESYPDKDGHKRYCETSKVLLRNEDGQPIGMYGTCHDVTEEVELKQYGQKQNKNLKRNAEVFEAMQSIYNVVLHFDLDQDRYEHVVGTRKRPEGIPQEGSIRTMFKDFLQYGICGPVQETDKCFFSYDALRAKIDQEGILTHEVNTREMGWVRIRIVAMSRDEEGKVRTCLWVSEPILQEMHMRKDLENRNAILAALRKVYDVCIYWNLEKNTYFRVYGRKDDADQIVPEVGVLDEVLSVWIEKELTPAYQELVGPFYDLATLQERLKRNEVLTMEVETRNGWLRTSLVAVDHNEEGNVVSCLWIGEDIDEEKKKVLIHTQEMEEATHEARTDALTNLANRGGCLKQIVEITESGMPALFALFDVNDFKHVNDVYGHAVGDLVLQKIADGMRSVFSDDDILARFGGDEFVLCTSSVSSKQEAIEKLDALVEEIEKKEYEEIGRERIRISMGAYYVNGTKNLDFKKVYELCDQAMYRCKEQIAVPYFLHCSCGSLIKGVRQHPYTMKDPVLVEKHMNLDMIHAFTSVYSFVCLLDLKQNRCTVLKAVGVYSSAKSEIEDLSKWMEAGIARVVSLQDQERIRSLLHVSTLSDRLTAAGSLRSEFMEQNTRELHCLRVIPVCKDMKTQVHLALLLID